MIGIGKSVFISIEVYVGQGGQWVQIRVLGGCAVIIIQINRGVHMVKAMWLVLE